MSEKKWYTLTKIECARLTKSVEAAARLLELSARAGCEIGKRLAADIRDALSSWGTGPDVAYAVQRALERAREESGRVAAAVEECCARGDWEDVLEDVGMDRVEWPALDRDDLDDAVDSLEDGEHWTVRR